MISRRIAGLITALFITLAVIAAACGGDDDEATPTPEASSTAAATPTPGSIDDGTPTPTPAPATTEAGMELTEFTITPAVTRARPGTVVFKVRNAGEVTHQFLVIRSDLGTADLPRASADRGVDETKMDVVGEVRGIAPGATGEVSVAVDAGKYVLIRNLFAGGKSHYLEGMYTAFEVTPTAPNLGPTPVPTPDVTPVLSPTP